MNSNEAAQLATLLLDTYAAAEQAKAEKTRSTIEARHLGHVEGTFTGVVRYAELACKAHGARITELVRRTHNQLIYSADFAARHGINLTDDDLAADLARGLVDLATRTTCGQQILWRDEDVAMARRDLAPFRCLRTPGHLTGPGEGCAMHPLVATKLDQGLPITSEDYQAPITAA